ncbi:MAG: hypothetical protein K6E56_05235 [Lachnospiraceae bacterium]|nr:hypothetical protein [Lachnospiraceae bacterium]
MKKIIALLFTVILLFSCTDEAFADAVPVSADDGKYAIDVAIEGGSGKASVVSPSKLVVTGGKAYVELVWSSSNYDYMIVEGVRYDNENEGGYSTFTVPVLSFDTPYDVIADTTAMGDAHEITYALSVYSDSLSDYDSLPQEAAKRVVYMALIIIVAGGILNHFVQKRKDIDFKGKRKK